MAIDLDDGIGNSNQAPPVKLPEVGDWLSGHLVHVEKGTTTNKRGQVKEKLFITVLVKDCSEGARVGWKESGYYAPKPGDEVVVHAEGRVWYAWIQARKRHQDLQIGDVMRWMFKDTTPNPTPNESDFANRNFDLRKPKADEGSWVVNCEARYHEIISGSQSLPDSDVSDEIAF